MQAHMATHSLILCAVSGQKDWHGHRHVFQTADILLLSSIKLHNGNHPGWGLFQMFGLPACCSWRVHADPR